MSQAEKFHDHIFNFAAQGVFQSTPRGKYLRVNPAMAKLFGYASPAEMIDSVENIAKQIYADPKEFTHFKQLLKRKDPIENFETRYKRKDGTIFWASISARAVYDKSGKVEYYAGFVQDITPRKEAEKALGGDEMLNSILVEQAPVTVYIDAPQDNVKKGIYVSSQIQALTGYTPEEWHAPDFWDNFIHPDDRERFTRENERTNKSGELFEMEYRAIHKNGSVVWLRDIAKLVRDIDGTPLYWHGALIDITEQKNLQQNARQSEDRFQKAFQASPIATCITTFDKGIFLDVNEAYLNLSGLTRERLIGHSVTELGMLNKKKRVKWLKEFLASGESLHKQNTSFITASGEKLATIAFYEGIELGGEKAILGMYYDISSQMRAEFALQQSEARHRAMVENIPAIVYTESVEEEPRIFYISPQVQTILGYPPEQWTEDRNFWNSLIHPEDRERVRQKDALANKTGATFSEEYRLIARDGKSIWVQDVSTLIRDEAGKPLYWQGFLVNVTGKIEAKDTTREIENAYRGLFDSISDAIYIQDKDGRYLDVNLGAVNMYGYPREAFIGKSSDFLGAPEKNDLTAIGQAIVRAFEGSPQQFEFWGKRKNGEIFPNDTRIFKGKYFGQDVIFAIARDVTNRRMAQDALERQLKELSVLHALTLEGTRSASESELLEYATEIIGYTLYPDTMGFLMVTEDGEHFAPHPSYRGVINLSQMHKHPIGRSIIGQVIQSGKPMNIPDVRKLTNHIQINPDTVSEICVPMTIGTHVIGVINAESAKPGFFTSEDERLLTTIAGQIATAIERMRKAQAEREQRILAEALRDIASVLSSTLDFDAVMERILENIDRVVPSKSANIMLLENDQLRIIRYRGYTDEAFAGWRDNFSVNIQQFPDMERGLRTLSPQLIPDTSLDHDWVTFPATKWIQSHIAAPIVIDNNAVGFINLDNDTPGFFTQRDAERLMSFANQAATAIQNARLFQAETRRRQEAETLQEAAALITTTLERDKAIEQILEQLNRVVPYDSASLQLLHDNHLEIVGGRGWDNVQAFIGIKFPVPGDNPNTRVIQNRKPLILNNPAENYPAFRQLPHENIKCWMGIPLIVQDRVVGMLSVDSRRSNHFNEEYTRLAGAFANQAAAAIENARLFQEESRRTKIIEALAEIANVIATTPDVRVVLEQIAERSLNLLQASHIAIYLLQDDNETLKIVTAKGAYYKKLLSHTIRVGQGITGSIVISGKPEIINDLTKDTRSITVPGTPDKDKQVETMMSAPLILRGKTIGAMNAWRLRTNGLFSETELNFLTSIAHQVSIAIESGRLFEETLRRAQETAAIAEVGRDISSTLKLDLVLQRIASYAKELLSSETSAVYLYEKGSSELWAIAATGDDEVEIKSDPLQLGTGILGNIALQKSGEIVNDTFTDPRGITVKGTKAIPFEHIMGAPVLLKDQLTGLLAVWRVGRGLEYKPSDLEFLNSLAQQAAIAIENARLFEAEQQRRHESETLREASAIVATTLDQNLAIELILDQLARVLKYDSASVQLLRNGHLEIVGGRGWPSNTTILGLRFPIPGDNPNTVVIQERCPLILNRAGDSYKLFHQEPHSHIQSWLGAPLIAHGEVIGMLSVDSTESGYFNEEHLRLVGAYANQAAVAIDNAQLHEQSENQIRRLTALRDVDTAIASSLDLRVTLNILMDNATSQLRADAMSILIYNPSLQILEMAAALGFQGHPVRRQFRIGEGMAGKIAISRQPLLVQEPGLSEEYSYISWLADEKFVTYMGYPLLGKGQVKGVIEAYFRAPFTPNADWLEFMQTMAGQAAIAIDNSQLFENLQRSNQELSLAYDTTLEGWGKALELRDKETQGHTKRVTELTIRLARRLNISDNEITHIRRGVLLHDIGKMGVPDHILRKTGPLDEDEWAQMRMHPQYAYDLLYPIAYLRPALDIPWCHHENWDGTGYPRGLKGEEIPLAARIFSIVDVWDALLSDRPYRQTWTRKSTIEYIKSKVEKQFDPRVVSAFLELISEIE